MAIQFGYSETYFNKMRSYFHQALEQGRMPVLFASPSLGRNKKTVNDDVMQHIISLRKMNHSILDIKSILDAKNIDISLNQIDNILKADGFARLPRRTKDEKNRISSKQLLIMQ